MKNLKRLTLLHSNDFHGDFLAEKVNEKLVGGVSRLSGYINKVRNEEKNVIYAIAGDMFRGSLIDSEFQGISTFQIMNLLAPDVVSLAHDKTVLKCHELKWPYCNGILKRWHQAGLHTVEEIAAGDRPGDRKEAPPKRDDAWKYV